jgi:hypothetical protein
MASLNLQIFRKDFSQFYTSFTTTSRNLARLKIDRFQNVICDGVPCQVFSIEVWPISRASNVFLKACLRLPVGLAGYRWRPSILALELLTPAVRNCLVTSACCIEVLWLGQTVKESPQTPYNVWLHVSEEVWAFRPRLAYTEAAKPVNHAHILPI